MKDKYAFSTISKVKQKLKNFLEPIDPLKRKFRNMA